MRGSDVTNQCVRLVLAVVVIALVSLSLYQFGGGGGEGFSSGASVPTLPR